mmetsp:Transcript_9184/g.16120  ORF Transcript_9184/g.16120 Transcript_9184/m.16120 type:complete len:87 (-) Transcript_9184:123-383(-)
MGVIAQSDDDEVALHDEELDMCRLYELLDTYPHLSLSIAVYCVLSVGADCCILCCLVFSLSVHLAEATVFYDGYACVLMLGVLSKQ